jgi:hypothetical protein
MPEQRPSPKEIGEIVQWLESLIDRIWMRMPLDSGDNPGSLPGLSNMYFGVDLLGYTPDPLEKLVKLFDKPPAYHLKSCGADSDKFDLTFYAGWSPEVCEVLDAIKTLLSALLYYLELKPLKPPPAWKIKKVKGRNKMIPSIEPPKYRPDRSKPFPAIILDGLKEVCKRLKNATNSRIAEASLTGPLTEPMSQDELGRLFMCHRNQVKSLVLDTYPHKLSGKKYRMQVKDMPPSYIPKTRSKKR